MVIYTCLWEVKVNDMQYACTYVHVCVLCMLVPQDNLCLGVATCQLIPEVVCTVAPSLPPISHVATV